LSASKLPGLTVWAFAALAGVASVSAQTVEVPRDAGLTMVPTRCHDANDQLVSLDGIQVLRNAIVTFDLNGVAMRSEIRRGAIWVRYGNEAEQSIFEPLYLTHYGATDARAYHGTLGGRPIIIWEELAENHSREAGVLEYRGRTMVPVCRGVIRLPEEEMRRAARAQRHDQGGNAASRD